MANNQIRVGIQFTADTTQAKQQIQNLQNTLQQISNTPIAVQGGNIDQAVNSAKHLQTALQSAVNVNTGKLNFNQLNTNLQKMGTSVTEVSQKLLTMGPEGQKAFGQLANSIASAELPTRRMNGLLARFGDTLLRTIRWQIASSMIHGFMSTVSQAVGYIEKLDDSLNAIQRVTQKNDTAMASFAKQANQLAEELSTVTKEYTDASLIFFQQGLDTAEVIERTNTTIKLAKVTGESVENISNQLTAIWNNFDDGTQSLDYYADVITALGASTASSSSEIANGMQKFAAVADTVGLSYERAAAALATVVAETRQSEDVVGTSFKTILARIEGLKLGETLDDGVTLNQYSSALAKIGVNILDANGNLKEMDDILDSMGNRWNTLSRAQQVSVAQTVAGVRQYSQFIALMDNYQEILSNEELARNSEGTLDKQFKTYEQSLEAVNERMEKAKQDIFGSLFNADDLKGAKEAITEVLNTINSIVKAAGGLKGIITMVFPLILSNYLPDLINKSSIFMTKMRDGFLTWAGKTPVSPSEKALNQLKGMMSQQAGTDTEMKYTEQILDLNYKLSKLKGKISEQDYEVLSRIVQQTTALKDQVAEAKRLQKAEKDRVEAAKNNLTRRVVENQIINADSLSQTEQLQQARAITQSSYVSWDNAKKGSSIWGQQYYKIKDLPIQIEATQKLLELESKRLSDEKNLTEEQKKQKTIIDDQIKQLNSIKTNIKGQERKQFTEDQYKQVQDITNNALEHTKNVDDIFSNFKEKFKIGEEISIPLNIKPEDTEIKSQIEIIKGQIKEALGEESANFINVDSASVKNIEDIVKRTNILTSQSQKIDSIVKDINISENKNIKLSNQQVKAINEISKSSTIVHQKLDNWHEGLESSQKNLININKEAGAIEGKFEELDENSIKKLQQALQEAQETTDGTANSFRRFLEVIRDSAPEEYRADMQKLIDGLFGVEDATEQARRAQEEYNKSQQETARRIAEASQQMKQGFGEMASATMRATSTISMVNMAANQLSKTFAGQGTILEKIMSIFSALNAIMQIHATLTQFLSGLQEVLTAKKIKDTAAQQVQNAAEAAGNTTKTTAIALTKGLTTATIALTVALGALMLVSALDRADKEKAAKAREEAAKKAKAEAEATKKLSEETKKEYEEFKKLREEYDSALKTWNSTHDNREELLNIGQKVITQLGDESLAVDLLNGNYKKLAETLDLIEGRKLEEVLGQDIVNVAAMWNSVIASSAADKDQPLTKNLLGQLVVGSANDKRNVSRVKIVQDLKDILDFSNGYYGLSYEKGAAQNFLIDYSKVSDAFRIGGKELSDTVLAQEAAKSAADTMVLDNVFAYGSLQKYAQDYLDAGGKSSDKGFQLIGQILSNEEMKAVYEEALKSVDDAFAAVVKNSGINNAKTVEEYNKAYETILEDNKLKEILREFGLENDEAVNDFLNNEYNINEKISEALNDPTFSLLSSIEKTLQNREGLEDFNFENFFKEQIKELGLSEEQYYEILLRLDYNVISDPDKLKKAIEAQINLDEGLELEKRVDIGLDMQEDWSKSKTAKDQFDFITKYKDTIIEELGSINNFFKMSDSEREDFFERLTSSANLYQKAIYDVGAAQEWFNSLLGDINFGETISNKQKQDAVNKIVESSDIYRSNVLEELGISNINEYQKQRQSDQYLDSYREKYKDYNLDQLLVEDISNFSDLEKRTFQDIVAEKYQAYLVGLRENAEKSVKENALIYETAKGTVSSYGDMLARENWEKDLESSNLKEDDVVELAKSLPDLVDSIDELDDSLKTNEEAQKQVALAIKQTEQGLKSLTDNYDDWKEALKGKDELAKVTALKDMKDAFADIFDITDELQRAGLKLGDHFGDYLLDHMDLVEKAADGDKEAILELQRVAAEDIILQLDLSEENQQELLYKVKGTMDDIKSMLDNNELQIGAIDDGPLMESLNKIINSVAMTTEQAEALLATMGFDAEVEDEPLQKVASYYRYPTTTAEPIEAGGDILGYNLVVDENSGGWQKVEGAEESVTALRIKTANYVGGGNISTKKGGTGRHSDNNKKSKGSGGGKTRSKKEPKKSEDEIERYHKINKTIDSLSKKYDKLSAAKDAAFGSQRLKYIEQENKLLQQQYETEKAKLKEIEAYYSKDRGAIEAYGAKIDNNGVITNYDEIMQQQLDKLNAKYAQYNAGGLSDEIIEAAEKDYEDFKKILSQFEETNGLYLDQLKVIEDKIREQISNELETIQIKLELQLELPDEQIKLLEFKLSTLENAAFASSERIALWGQEAEKAASKIDAYAQAFKDTLTMAVYDEEGNKTGGFGLTDDQANHLMAGDASVIDEAGITGENAQAIIDALKNYEDGLIEQYSTILNYRNSIEQELTNQFNEYNDAIEKQISKIEKLGNIAKNIKTLIGTVGKEAMGITADIMNSINETILQSSKGQIDSLRAQYEGLEKAAASYKEELQKAIASGDEERIKYWQEQNNIIEDKMLDTKDRLLSTINDYATQAAEIMIEKVKDSFDELARTMYGMTTTDAIASYDRYKTLTSDYLKDYQKIYELSKLNRNIENSINNTDNIRAKERLRNLQEEINKYQAEGVQMTQYEVDYLNKKYELRQAEIALEEAQNAKDQVRLSRNTDGGWGYVYTANTDNIDKAQQNYEDKLYALQQLNQQAIEDSQSTILQLEQEFEESVLEVLQNNNLSEEEKQARIEELQRYYLARMQVYHDTLGQALDNNKELYNEDWKEYNRLTGYRISADKDYLDEFNKTWMGKQGIGAGINSVAGLFENYQNRLGTYDGEGVLGATYTALSNYNTQIGEILGKNGLSGTIGTHMGNIQSSIDNATGAAQDLATEMGTNLPNTATNVSNWQTIINPILGNLRTTITNVNTAVQTLITSLTNLGNIHVNPTVEATLPSGTPTTQVTNTPAAGSGSGETDENNTPNETSKRKKKKKEYISLGEKNHKVIQVYTNGESEEIGIKPHDWNPTGRVEYNGYQAKEEEMCDKCKQIRYHVVNKNNDKETYVYPNLPTFASGGYTGEWGPEGRLAMLHQKELVLNKDDTENMLKMVSMVRDSVNKISIGNQLSNFNAMYGRYTGIVNHRGFDTQNITIEAHFPNAINHTEIEEAFRNLSNYAAQNAYNFDFANKINIF